MISCAAPPKVLIVDDEPDIRQLLYVVLKGHGYAVFSAARPSEAFAHLERHPDISLAICDVSMPEKSGPQLVAELREISPLLPVLYMSGYTAECLVQQGIMPPDAFMAKPFALTLLIDKVRALTGSAAAA